MSACERCGHPMFRAISMGLPLRMCEDTEDCATADGPAIWLHNLFPWTFTGYLLRYEGSYWRALWRWLWGVADE